MRKEKVQEFKKLIILIKCIKQKGFVLHELFDARTWIGCNDALYTSLFDTQYLEIYNPFPPFLTLLYQPALETVLLPCIATKFSFIQTPENVFYNWNASKLQFVYVLKLETLPPQCLYEAIYQSNYKQFSHRILFFYVVYVNNVSNVRLLFFQFFFLFLGIFHQLSNALVILRMYIYKYYIHTNFKV